LAKFDGTNWTVYNTSNSGIPGNSVESLAIDPQGKIWVGTDGGLGKFDGVNWAVYNRDNSGLLWNSVSALAIDAEGNIWIGGDGLAVYREGGVMFPRLTAVEEAFSAEVPSVFSLSRNTPNPFNPVTVIRYVLPEVGEVTLVIYNTMGRRVQTLVVGRQEDGVHEVVWDGRDDRGYEVASGVYLCRLTVGTFAQTRKLVVLR